MPLIRFVTDKDIAARGSDPVVVHENTAYRMVEMRRAVRMDTEGLGDLTKSQLEDVAEQVGADVRKRDPKGHFVKAIAEAENDA